MTSERPPIRDVSVGVYEVPTDEPEADGTLAWSSTTVVVVSVGAGDIEGTGWTYAGSGCRAVVDDHLAPVVVGADPMDVPALNEAMVRACRNLGRPGLVSCALSAVDIALWDLKARLLDLPLVKLFGQVREAVPIYGSGGFTTYDEARTKDQLERWTGEWRIPRVKIKIGQSWGTNPGRDLRRVDLTRQVVGPDVELYVDANGAYTTKQAIRLGHIMVSEHQVSWFEEPVSSDDLWGLRQVRDQCRGRRCRRGVRVRPCVLRPHGRRPSRRLPADRCHPVRRLHRVAPGGGTRARSRARGVGTLRPQSPRAGRRCRSQSAPRRVFPRPSPGGDPALRRDALAGRGGAVAVHQPGRARSGTRAVERGRYRIA